MGSKLFDLDEINSIASNTTTENRLLSSTTRQLFMACFALLSNPENWQDEADELTDAQIDEIDNMVSTAMDEI